MLVMPVYGWLQPKQSFFLPEKLCFTESYWDCDIERVESFDSSLFYLGLLTDLLILDFAWPI